MELLIDKPQSFEEAKNAGLPVFKMFSDGAVKAYQAENKNDGVPRVTLTASTSMTDLVADVMSANSLERMRVASLGRTFFLNHDYKVPEDVFGVIEDAVIVEREVKDTFTGQMVKCLCLDFVVAVEITNPRAVKCYEMIAAGRTRLGASIGVLIIDSTPGKDGRTLINDVYFLECSLVGIPANQYSWVQYASKALDMLKKSALATTATTIETAVSSNANANAGLIAKLKGVFAEELTERMETVSLWEMCDTLTDVIYDLLWQYIDGDVEDPEPILAEILQEFSSAVMEQMKKQWRFGETEAEEDSSTKLAGLKTALLQVQAAKAFASVTLKAGARNSKTDLGRLQSIHDLSSELGADCANKTASADAAEAPNNEAYQLAFDQAQGEIKSLKEAQALLQEDNAGLKSQLTAAQTTANQWQAGAQAALLSLKRYGQEPMPRAGMQLK